MMENVHLWPEPPRFVQKRQKSPKKHKNARNLVIFWNLGKVKYTIVLEIGCQ